MSKEYLPGTIFQFNAPPENYEVNLKNLPKINYNYKAPTPFKIIKNIQQNKVENEYPYKGILHENRQDSPFSLLYFSKTNINEVQRRIRNKVYDLSNGAYKIGPQDETSVVLVMRETYLKYAMDELNINKFKDDINYLNDISVKEMASTILKNIIEHVAYIRDKTNPYGGVNRTLPLPESTSTTGLNNYD